MVSVVERRLLLVTIAVSLLLSALTIWAVVRQGRALLARELADLRSAAATVVAQQRAALRADTLRNLDNARAALDSGGPDELDAWVGTQATWLLAALCRTDAVCAFYPRPPLDEPAALPAVSAAVQDTGQRSLLEALPELRRQATGSDPLAQAGALLAIAACEQQLGRPLAAARVFAEAAQVLRSTPRLTRLAFRAELARVAALQAAGDQARAQGALSDLLTTLLADHPARLSEVEIERLSDQLTALGLAEDEDLNVGLAELVRRARRRTAMIAAARRALTRRATETFTADGPIFDYVRDGTGEVIVIASAPASAVLRVALVTPAAILLARYCCATDLSAWQVDGGEGAPAATLLAELGSEFGGARLVATPATDSDLRRAARRHQGLVAATALGTVGAWALVIWMMIRAVRQQRELLRMQGRFVADVSHELKTPLALIRLLAETLAEQRVRDAERVQSYHETIARQAEHLTVLLDNILDLGRIESGRKQYQFASCDIAAVARQAWLLFEPQLQQEGFTTRLEIAPDLPIMRADAHALHQVIVNLLQNAYRYAGQGKYVRLTVRREGAVMLISVEDHGIGMSRQQLKRLGESFFRGDDTQVRQAPGVGLGLAIVNHIVSAHRGKIEVQSRPGQGTTFTVWIPLEAEH